MKKAVVFIVVWGIIIMVSLLSIAAINLMGNQARVAQHTSNRIEAYYTAKAGMYKALDMLRQGNTNAVVSAADPNLNNLVANINVSDGCPSLTSNFAGCKTVSVSVAY